MNDRHLDARGGDDALAARVRSYELAAKMQLAVPRGDGASTAKRRPRTRCMGSTARRRPISAAAACWRGGCSSAACDSCSCFPAARSAVRGINWDGHENMVANHGQEAAAHRSARGRLAARSAAARHAGRHAGAVHHRVRPHAVHAIGGRRGRAWGATTISTVSRCGWPAPDCGTA